MGDFRMPSLGADMTHGKLIEWRVKPGDAVKKGDIVAVIGTDKADIEVEIFESGVIGELIARPGQELPVGATLATLAGAPPAAKAEIKASPIARRMARELGIDLATLHGTGPHGVIEKHDVEAAARPAPPPPPPLGVVNGQQGFGRGTAAPGQALLPRSVEGVWPQCSAVPCLPRRQGHIRRS